MSYITHPSIVSNCQNFNTYEQASYPNQGYCTMPYEYEEISNPNLQTQQQQMYYKTETCGNETETTPTVFEDLSENLKHLDAKEPQCYRLPPPISKPPPIPTKVI